MDKLKITKSSKKDKDKVTVRINDIEDIFDTQGDGIGLVDGRKFILTFKTGRKTYDVAFRVSRDGTTAYGACPRGLRMPSVGKPVYYTVVDGIGVDNV